MRLLAATDFRSWADLKLHVESAKARGSWSYVRSSHYRQASHRKVRAEQGWPVASSRRRHVDHTSSTDSEDDRQHLSATLVVEFELMDDTVTLTQIAVDAARRETADEDGHSRRWAGASVSVRAVNWCYRPDGRRSDA